MKPPEHFITEQHNRLKITRRDTISRSEVLAIIQQHEQETKDRRETIIKNGPKSTVSLLPVLLEGKKQNLCLKKYKFKGWANALKNIFIPSRAMRSLKTAETFELLGIKTAIPLAMVEKRRGFIPKESMLVMEDISEHPGLPEYIEKVFSPSISKDHIQQKRTFIKAFALFLCQLHNQGVYQNDFKTTNVFVEVPLSKKKSFWLIDLDQISFLKKVSTRQKVKNLCQINTSIPGKVTLADRLRFFHCYTGKRKLEKKDRKMIKKILRSSWKRNPRWHPRFRMNAETIRKWQ